MASASAANAQTIDSTGENIFDSNGGKCTTICIKVASGSANGALVNIPGLHSTNAFFPIAAGEKEYFRYDYNGIATVFCKGNGGNATVSWGVISRIGH
jgi:hypothetical protein